MAHIINDRTKQLLIPGIKPYFTKFFRQYYCGQFEGQNGARDTYSLGCAKPTAIMAIWFVMGNYNEDDNKPELVGFDCPFDDSEQLYACSSAHLGAMLARINDCTLESSLEEKAPDIIVNAQGRIEKEIYLQIMKNVYGFALTPDFSETKSWSRRRESLEQLWEREKWRFISEK